MWGEGELLFGIKFQGGYLFSHLGCSHPPWDNPWLSLARQELPWMMGRVSDNLGSLFASIFWPSWSIAPKYDCILKINKEHLFREFRGWMSKDLRYSECGRQNILWKSTEIVAFLLFIFEILAICMRNYYSKSKPYVSFHLICSNSDTLKVT